MDEDEDGGDEEEEGDEEEAAVMQCSDGNGQTRYRLVSKREVVVAGNVTMVTAAPPSACRCGECRNSAGVTRRNSTGGAGARRGGDEAAGVKRKSVTFSPNLCVDPVSTPTNGESGSPTSTATTTTCIAASKRFTWTRIPTDVNNKGFYRTTRLVCCLL